MFKDSRWFQSDQFESEALKWISIFCRGENLSLLSFPKMGRTRRIDQFINDPQIKEKLDQASLDVIRTDVQMMEDTDDIKQHILLTYNQTHTDNQMESFPKLFSYYLSQHRHLALIVGEAEQYLHSETQFMLVRFSQFISEYKDVFLSMCIFETNILYPDILPLLPSDSSIYQNIMYYPLYLHEDTARLIRHVAIRLGYKITREETDGIIRVCGGHIWLASEAVRQLSVDGKWSPESYQMKYRLRILASFLTESEKNVILNQSKPKRNDEADQISFDYLYHMRCITNSGKSTIPILLKYLTSLSSSIPVFEIQSQKITLNRVPLDRLFSRKESRVLKYLIAHANIIVTRDDIARILWPDDTLSKYSDWAIDQIMKRIRKRFISLSLSTRIIRTVRNKGYIMES
jgi:hypothetical protein